jgi:topoisomerase-4 subunit B
VFTGRGDVEISRFKGLGEMPAPQLRSTTMDPATRRLLRVRLPDKEASAERAVTAELIEALMGRKPEARLAYIMQHASFVRELDV